MSGKLDATFGNCDKLVPILWQSLAVVYHLVFTHLCGQITHIGSSRLNSCNTSIQYLNAAAVSDYGYYNMSYHACRAFEKYSFP